MPNDRAPQEHQIRRALLGELGDEWLERTQLDEERLGIAHVNNTTDGRMFGVADTEAAEVFRLMRFWDPELAEEPYFQLLEYNHMQREATAAIRAKVPDLGLAALMSSGFQAGRHYTRVRPGDWSRVDDYFAVYSDAGPTRSGMVELVLGLPGSGKTTYLVWRAIEGTKRGYETFADFHVNGKLEPGGFHEVYQCSDLLLRLITFARTSPKLPGQVLLGDAGGRGGESKTASTLEARWAMLLMTRARMFRVNFGRAHQVDKLPDDQRQLVTSVIRKDASDPSVIRGEWLQGPRAGIDFAPFTIDRLDDRFSTWAKAAMVWDVDMEDLFSYLSFRRGGNDDELDIVERYVLAAQRGEPPDPEWAARTARKGARAPQEAVPAALAEKPDGGWRAACTRHGCGAVWTYNGDRLPVGGARIRCPNEHKITLAEAIVAGAKAEE